MKWFMILGASAALSGSILFAQNDLEALLEDLGGDAKPAVQAPAKADDAKKAAEAKKQEEEKAAAEKAKAEKEAAEVKEAAPAAEKKAEEKVAEVKEAAKNAEKKAEEKVAEVKEAAKDAEKKVEEGKKAADADVDDLLKDLTAEKKDDAPTAEKPAKAKPEQPAVAEEKPAEAPAVEKKAEEKVAEVKEAAKDAEKKADVDNLLNDLTEKPAEKKAEAEKPVEEKPAVAEEKPAEAPVAVEGDKPEAEKPVAVEGDKTEAKADAPAAVEGDKPEAEKPEAKAAADAPVDETAAIISELEGLERIRVESMDQHGKSSLESARTAMRKRDYETAATQYQQAIEFISNRPANAALIDEARKGLGEAYYRDALEKSKNNDNENARILAVKAQEAGHPQAARLLESLQDKPATVVVDTSKISHRVNDEDHKIQRTETRRRMRRARQLCATGEYTKALEQCELILRDYPDTKEAMVLRDYIADRMKQLSDIEFEATRSYMIREVRDTWNTKRYAVDSAELPKGQLEMTAKDGKTIRGMGSSAEQMVQEKLDKIIIPEVNFRPPATIIDAVNFFNNASRDYDNPELPMEKRGVNLVLKLAQGGGAAAAPAGEDNADPFAAAAPGGGNAGGAPVIPAVTARFITLKEALKLVCDVSGMKFLIRGPVVMIVPVNEPDTDLITRSYNVLSSISDRVSAAQSEIASSKKGGDNTFLQQDDMSQKQDWKAFFGELGVQWPEGSSIAYVSTIGKLRVKNTAENLAVFEQVLEDLNITPRLIEIEARFVEVSQEDLNSLGFEWLLNGDFSFGVPGFLGKNFRKYTTSGTTIATDSAGAPIQVYDADGNLTYVKTTRYAPYTSPGRLTETLLNPEYDDAKNLVAGTYYRNDGLVTPVTQNNLAGTINPLIPQYGNVYRSGHKASISAIDGQSYSTGQRFLSQEGNHISGEGGSKNDQFMKINAIFGNADLSMILHMLSQRSDTDLLNAPRVVTKNGQEAVMKVVTEYIYPTEYDVEISQNGSSSSTSGNSADPIATVEPQNFEMREVGTILQVVPEVSPEGQMINLMLNPQVVSEPTWKNYGTQLPKTVYRPATAAELAMNPLLATQNGGMIAETGYIQLPMEQPFFSVRSVSTQLSVYNGATVVIGGLITEERKTMEDKIPLLGDIPYLGRLFRSKSEYSNKRNLLIFITARLVDPAGKLIRQSEGDSLLKGGEESGTPPAEGGAAPQAPAAEPAATVE
ncbi:MAG: hypothetical protein IKR48_00070 [Kiritimatiellae bacterium]|nr:hypothetical protein [Kiritimatiellia bacterium]